ncbi:PH domain-containing protein [Shouchella clausii]|uniref:PH domain-containing protein n=1 Tax=Shouchella TaxID=2893057 RepID=UPI0007C5664B|nr:PH domain-containing protein [Shouchella clausii]MCM3314965.1 PH domain-containing protein [Psychrobacillus sp. MER TA 17]MDO7270196.1 PH domain-containing protein [Shouchella clausii]MDO7289969.1 PH domain-containing protein [Shouchella clausii]PAD45110.1 hypothetical protein CHI09_19165 [Shouchella clausii]PAE79098.1 hypothetical protein CHH77_20910 [Shouchella clausii]
MVFKSEKGITYSVIMYSLMIVLSIDIVFDLNVAAFPVQNAFIKKPVLVLFLLLIGSIFFRTKYVLKPKSKTIVVVFGFYKKTININTINAMRFTKDFFASPALSSNKIEIEYNHSNLIRISPKEKQFFIEQVKKINPDIHIKQTKRKY